MRLGTALGSEPTTLNFLSRLLLEAASALVAEPFRFAPDTQFWGFSNAATIAFLRHAEMKHGRIAMLAFWGYTVQANGWTFPWATEANGFPPASLTPPEQWEVFSPFAKFQLLFFIGALELWSEAAPGQPHYMRAEGGRPGAFPPFLDGEGKPIPGLPASLWDPLGMTRSLTAEEKALKLAKEVNNGRLAMLGLMSFLVESKVPGAVPVLTWFHVVPAFEGEYMLPVSYWDFVNYFLAKSDFFPSAASVAAEAALDHSSW